MHFIHIEVNFVCLELNMQIHILSGALMSKIIKIEIVTEH